MRTLDLIIGLFVNLLWVGGSMVAFIYNKPIYGFGILTVWILLEILSKTRSILFNLEQTKRGL